MYLLHKLFAYLAEATARPLPIKEVSPFDRPDPAPLVKIEVELPDEKDWPDKKLIRLAEGKTRPFRIYEVPDLVLYFKATEDERKAWNRYVERAVDEFNSNPSLDSYDSVDVYPGFTRSGRQTPWIPPHRFPEWVAKKRAEGR